MSAHILLIEDEPALLSTLKVAVGDAGFTEESAGSGTDALRVFEGSQFDAVLMDLGLPDLEGGEVLRRLRERSDVPIIVVSGRATERDKIEALDLGADDYVAKPFLAGELLARIRAALRRNRKLQARLMESQLSEERRPIRIGALLLDPFYRAVELGGARVHLSAAEFTLLRALAESPGAPTSKAELLAILYGDEAIDDTRVVEVFISKIRRKLRPLTESEIVVTVPGHGWTLAMLEA